VRSIRVRLQRTPDGVLELAYSIEGTLGQIRIPTPRPPRKVDGLWNHTCCELFVRVSAEESYYEFNFAPSGEWAVYAFQTHRHRVAGGESVSSPQIMFYKTGGVMELSASVSLGQLSSLHTRAKLSVGLATVVEDVNGRLSYWALAHGDGKPDFHNPVAFALDLDEIRN
jgi:hypothetical protein